VPSEFRFHRLGDLTGLKIEKRGFEFRHHHVRLSPAQVATLLDRSRLVGIFSGLGGKIFSIFNALQKRPS